MIQSPALALPCYTGAPLANSSSKHSQDIQIQIQDSSRDPFMLQIHLPPESGRLQISVFGVYKTVSAIFLRLLLQISQTATSTVGQYHKVRAGETSLAGSRIHPVPYRTAQFVQVLARLVLPGAVQGAP